jgi:ABC-type sugar transport system permease subunit
MQPELLAPRIQPPDVALGSRLARWARRQASLLFFAPLLAMILVFMAYPLFETFRVSLMKVALNGDETYTGLENFRIIFANPVVGEVLRNTLVWVAANVVGMNVGGLLVALLLNQEFRLKPLFMVIILLPWATPVIASVIGWIFVYDPLYGHVNSLLLSLGLMDPVEPWRWLGDTKVSLLGVAVARTWTGIPFCAFSILAALLAIPTDLIKAARIDGGSSWNIFWRITLPLIYPTLTVLIVLTSIWAFNSFDIIYVMTGGGPVYASEILVINVYRNVFQFFKPGLASALSVVSFTILATATLLYAWLNTRLRAGGLQG